MHFIVKETAISTKFKKFVKLIKFIHLQLTLTLAYLNKFSLFRVEFLGIPARTLCKTKIVNINHMLHIYGIFHQYGTHADHI